MTQPTVTVGSRRGRHTTRRPDPTKSIRSAYMKSKTRRQSTPEPARSITAFGFEDEPASWSEPPKRSVKAGRTERKPVLLPETFQELVQNANRGEAWPRRTPRSPVVRNGVDITSQLWSGVDLRELVSSEPPELSRWMRRVNRWASPTITTLLVIALGIALRLAAG